MMSEISCFVAIFNLNTVDLSFVLLHGDKFFVLTAKPQRDGVYKKSGDAYLTYVSVVL